MTGTFQDNKIYNVHNKRTDTIPFIALNLLDDDGLASHVLRRYRHDIEPFIWVLVWMVLEEDVTAWWMTVDAQLSRSLRSVFLFLDYSKILQDSSKVKKGYFSIGNKVLLKLLQWLKRLAEGFGEAPERSDEQIWAKLTQSLRVICHTTCTQPETCVLVLSFSQALFIL